MRESKELKEPSSSIWRPALYFLAPAALLWLAGCSGSVGDSTAPALVNLGGTGFGNGNNPAGNAVCLQCHYSFPSNAFTNGDVYDTRTYADAGTGIGANYQKGLHNSDLVGGAPQCETCHGDGGQHFGTGPIPRWAPSFQQCGSCHTGNTNEWLGTAHANSNGLPDKFFGQGSLGTAQATADDGSFLFKIDGVTPVSKNERVEECSVCHDYSQNARPKHIATGDIHDNPQASCGSCHDSHSPSLRDKPVGVRSRPDGVPGSLLLRFKPVRVNNDPALPQYGAKNEVSGTWIRPTLNYAWNLTTVANDPGYATQVTTAGDSLRLNSERLCAACHTQGNWKHTAFKGGTAYKRTHNQDVFSQYRQAGHSRSTDNPYATFSLLAAVGGSRRPQFPIDMGKLPNPFPGAYPATATSDPTKDGRLTSTGADNYICYQCHNGIGSIDYMKGVQGGLDIGDSKEAHILYGDSTTTCLTCHDPHENGGTAGLAQKNVRIPVYQSYNLFFNDINNPGHGNRRGGFKGMMDGTSIPAGALNTPSQVCLFCHQGRESGYTLYRKFKALGLDYFTAAPGSTYTGSTTPGDEHHLAGGALLWSKNSYEYRIGGVAQTYSDGIPQHQQKNCTGCHMADVTDTDITSTTHGGHTFKPDVKTCQECHPGTPDFLSVLSPKDIDGDPSTVTVYDSIGDYTKINWTVAPQPTDKGLLNMVRWAYYQQNIEMDGTTLYKRINPYNKAVNHVTANRLTTWTPEQQQVLFNFGSLQNGNVGNALYVHNYYYASQILIDSCRALGLTANPATGKTFERPTAPPGGTTHQATDYSQIVVP